MEAAWVVFLPLLAGIFLLAMFLFSLHHQIKNGVRSWQSLSRSSLFAVWRWHWTGWVLLAYALAAVEWFLSILLGIQPSGVRVVIYVDQLLYPW